jgi:hypothetical protein
MLRQSSRHIAVREAYMDSALSDAYDLLGK